MPTDKPVTQPEAAAPETAPEVVQPTPVEPAPEAAIEAAPEAAIETTIDDFCRDLSRTDRRVELIAGFHHEQCARDHHKDTADAFAARFKSFCEAPAS